MKQIYQLSVLFLFGFSLSLYSQNDFQFGQQEETVQSMVFSNNIHSNYIDLGNNLHLQDWQRKSGMPKELKAFLIWTGVGLVSGYTLVTLSVLKNGPYEDHLTKGETIWFFGTILTLYILPIGMGLGLMHAVSISSYKPKEKTAYLF